MKRVTAQRPIAVLGVMALAVVPVFAQKALPPEGAGTSAPASEMRDVVDRYVTDRGVLGRRYPASSSPQRLSRMKQYFADWRARVAAIPFEPLSLEGRVDHILLRSRIDYEDRLLARETAFLAEMKPLLPFSETIHALNDARVAMQKVDPAKAAATLDRLASDIDAARRAIDAMATKPSRFATFGATEETANLKQALEGWYNFYAGYDPLFTWWNEAPQKKVVRALDSYRAHLRERVLGIRQGEDDPIVGVPIGREALALDLQSEFIPYSPEELLVIADREYAWIEGEMKKASRAMGFGDDWLKAVEKVKTMYVAPGDQPQMILDLALEAQDYVEKNNLITVPPLAKEVWRMSMMSPERQRVSPFFLGGEVIQVSYPTDAMDHQDKMMSMRGNNPYFSRSTVHHELIPGHHLQGFMTQRYNSHRRAFGTPFWGEGWALYWEFLLWDRNFADTPERKVGMLFWRMHRAARIMFSLGFHLGKMTPQQCVDLLVDRVGHERANAEAEVRRSFNGSYPPLYQLAYMMGGLQFHALHKELVGPGKMTDKAFHDFIITGGTMPVELVRARLTKQNLTKDHKASWKYAGAIAAQ